MKASIVFAALERQAEAMYGPAFRPCMIITDVEKAEANARKKSLSAALNALDGHSLRNHPLVVAHHEEKSAKREAKMLEKARHEGIVLAFAAIAYEQLRAK